MRENGDERKPSLLSSLVVDNTSPNTNTASKSNIPSNKRSVWKLKDSCEPMFGQQQQYSALAIAPDGAHYLALGDSMGYVTIYSTAPITLPINRLVTRASKRQSSSDMLKKIDGVKMKLSETEKDIMSLHNSINVQRGSKGASRLLFSSNPNVIESLAFTFNSREIVVGTKFEIELLDLSSEHGCFGRSLWYIDHIQGYCENISTAIYGKILKLSTHPNNADRGILIGLHCFESPPGDADNMVNPLVICDARGNSQHVKLRDSQGEPIKLGPKAVAIWGKLVSSHLIFTSCTTIRSIDENDLKHEILAFDVQTFEVCHRVTLPHGVWNGKQTKTLEVINIHSSGKFVLAASFRGGIRMFDSLNLTLMSTFAEGFSLHGHSIQWQDCYFADIPSCDTNDSRNLISYVVGIPHAFREPMEMIDKIHFWNTKDSEKKLPSLTLLGPNSDLGLLSIQYVGINQSIQVPSFFALDTLGQFHQLQERFVTNFPGVMYPPGYIVINNNIEYIEDESELDVVVDESIHEYEGSSSLYHEESCNASEFPDDEIIDVLSNDPLPTIIKCSPERYLQYEVYKSQHLGGSISARLHANQNDIFSLLPKCDHLISKKRADYTTTTSKNGVPRALAFKARSSIEALIKSSVIPSLHDEMLRRETWSDGMGSSISPDIAMGSCPACRGRYVIHSCGKRALPIDHDLEATKAAENLEREKEAARQRRLEKNRERDRMRRAERKRKKEEALRQSIGNEEGSMPKKLVNNSTLPLPEMPLSSTVSDQGKIHEDSPLTEANSIERSTTTTQITKDILLQDDISGNNFISDKSDNNDTQVGLRLELLAKLKAEKMDDEERLRVETAQEKREKILRTKRERERLRREAKKAEKKRQEALRLLRIVNGEHPDSPPTPTTFPAPPDNVASKVQNKQTSPKAVQAPVPQPQSEPHSIMNQPILPQHSLNTGVSHWGLDNTTSSALALMGFPTQFGPMIPAMIPLMNSVAGNPYIFPSAGFLPFSNGALAPNIPSLHTNVAPTASIAENTSMQHSSPHEKNQAKPSADKCAPVVTTTLVHNNAGQDVKDNNNVSSNPAKSATTSDRDAAISMLELNATPYSDMLHGKGPE